MSGRWLRWVGCPAQRMANQSSIVSQWGAENGALLSFSLTLGKKGKGKGVWLGKETLKERELVQIDSRLFYPIWAVCLPPQPCKTVMIHRTEKVKIQRSKRPITTNHHYVCCPFAGLADRPFQEPQPQTEHRFRPYLLLPYVPLTIDGCRQNFFHRIHLSSH